MPEPSTKKPSTRQPPGALRALSLGQANYIPSRLLEAAREASLRDGRFDGVTPEGAIFKYSELIAKDFSARWVGTGAKAQRMRGGTTEAAREVLSIGGMPLVLAIAYTDVL